MSFLCWKSSKGSFWLVGWAVSILSRTFKMGCFYLSRTISSLLQLRWPGTQCQAGLQFYAHSAVHLHLCGQHSPSFLYAMVTRPIVICLLRLKTWPPLLDLPGFLLLNRRLSITVQFYFWHSKSLFWRREDGGQFHNCLGVLKGLSYGQSLVCS